LENREDATKGRRWYRSNERQQWKTVRRREDSGVQQKMGGAGGRRSEKSCENYHLAEIGSERRQRPSQ